MDEQTAKKLLTDLLDDKGARWVCEQDCISFWMRQQGLVWEVVCRVRPERIYIYGRWPAVVTDPQACYKKCSDINQQVTTGALYLSGEGYPVFRTDAGLDDIYMARERLMKALEYNAKVIVHFWRQMTVS